MNQLRWIALAPPVGWNGWNKYRSATPRTIRLDWSVLSLLAYLTPDVRDLWYGKP